MKVKDLKKILKEFNDEDDVLVEWVLFSAWWHEDWGQRDMKLTDISTSKYDWKTRIIISVS